MAVLQTAAPANTQSSILYGPGNPDITSSQIKDFIATPGMTAEQIQQAAIQNGVSADQISTAMAGNPQYSPSALSGYLGAQGITPPQPQIPNPDPYKPIEYQPITNVDAVQDPLKGTVAGQLTTVLDPNSQIMQRAAYLGDAQSNKRGLLNSSIGVSSAMAPMIDAGLQIATPDAASNNQFNLFNTQNQNATNQFNASNGLSASVANAGNLKDLSITQSNNNLQMAVSNLDANTKLKIANIDAVSKDSSYAASLNQQLMSSIVEINKQDKPVEVRQAEIKQLVDLTTQSIGMLQSFDASIPALNFDTNPGASTTGSSNTSSSGSGSTTGGSSVIPTNDINKLNYQVEPSVMAQAAVYEKNTGQKVDPSKIVPEALIEDMRYGPVTPNFSPTYTGSDGLNHMRNYTAYDYNALTAQVGASNWQDAFDMLFAPVWSPDAPPETGVPPMFYVYR